MIPNGSGNQWAYTLGIESPDEALDTVIEAHVVRADLVRVLTDTEKVEEIPVGLSGYNRRRYYMGGCVDGDIPKMVNDAIPLKPYFGNAAYFILMLKFMLVDGGLQQRNYELEVDGVRVSKTKDGKDSIVTTSMYTASSKF